MRTTTLNTAIGWLTEVATSKLAIAWRLCHWTEELMAIVTLHLGQVHFDKETVRFAVFFNEANKGKRM